MDPLLQKAQNGIPLDSGAAAQEIQQQALAALTTLLEHNYPSPLDAGFMAEYHHLLELLHRFQQAVLSHHAVKPSCSGGCATCCYHWVEDVNSFEIIIIADYLKRHHPTALPAIVQQCREDLATLEQLYEVVQSKFAQEQAHEAGSMDALDEIDVLLGSFYQFQRPCPLLDKQGLCMIYPLRPLTCRIYLSFSDPQRCHPDYINEADTPTYLLDFDEPVNELFDRLHERYQAEGEGDTGLRSLLLTYLS